MAEGRPRTRHRHRRARTTRHHPAVRLWRSTRRYRDHLHRGLHAQGLPAPRRIRL